MLATHTHRLHVHIHIVIKCLCRSFLFSARVGSTTPPSPSLHQINHQKWSEETQTHAEILQFTCTLAQLENNTRCMANSPGYIYVQTGTIVVYSEKYFKYRPIYAIYNLKHKTIWLSGTTSDVKFSSAVHMHECC